MPDSLPDASGQPLFLEEFLAECEEHLSNIRQTLISLEATQDLASVESAVIEGLFRGLHSIKGNCGMVGLAAGEQLAHALEDHLRLLKSGTTALTRTGVTGMTQATATLAKVIESFCARVPLPDIAKSLAALRKATLANGRSKQKRSTRSAGKQPSTTPPAPPSERRRWRFTFRPSVALDARGININSVRERLGKLGTMINATPRVLPEGGILFEFELDTDAQEATFCRWRDDGLDYTEITVTASDSVNGHATKAAPTMTTPTVPHRASSLVRVDLARLDALMHRVGDMVVNHARLDTTIKAAAPELSKQSWRDLQESNIALARQLRGLREDVMRTRMVPVREVFERLRFVVLTLKNELALQVHLDMRGENTEIDKYLVDRLMDPLLHLVRNALTHGLERPAERQAAGKAEEGRLTLSATTFGDSVIIEVEDDGRGLATQAIIARAQALGPSVSPQTPSPDQLLDILCTPGFSMRDAVDKGSGRGVGMDVVRTVIRELGGQLSFSTEVGRKTCFRLQLPLTLAITDALIVQCGTRRYAIPQSNVQDVIEVASSAIKILENNEIIPYRDATLPVLRLSRYFGASEPANGIEHYHAFVLNSGIGSRGILVQRIVALQQIVVRPLTDPLVRVPGITGAADLGDGQPVLILDANALTKAR